MATLVSTAEYKTWRGITGSSQDTLIAFLLGMSSAYVRRACGRNLTNGFESATRTETYSGTDETTIQLQEWPITSVTSVTQLFAGGSTQALDSTTYRFNADTGILSRIDAVRGRFASFGTDGATVAGTWRPEPMFADGFFNFSVVYVGGYSTIPADLHQAVCQLTDILYVGRGRDPSLKSESLGQYSWTAADAAQINQIKMDLIRPYNTGST